MQSNTETSAFSPQPSALASGTPESTGAVRYYIWDHLGTTRVVTDGNGALISTHDYEPFGVEIPPLGGTGDITDLPSPNSHKFTGHERDQSTGYDYMHFRYYGSNIGRFMKPDNVTGSPLNPQNWNLYSYVRGNPVNMNDPTGHFGDLSQFMGDLRKAGGPKVKTEDNSTPQGDDGKDSPPEGASNQASQENQQKQSGSSTDTTTTVTLNSRAADIPGGQLLHDIGINHQWISTSDGVSVGMGTEEGVPQSDMPGVKTEVVDHSGQVPTSTETFLGVDKAALATYTNIGTPTGRWIPGVNDCNTWANEVIENSTPHNVVIPIVLPTGIMPLVLNDVVEYQDGSIHSPGGR